MINIKTVATALLALTAIAGCTNTPPGNPMYGQLLLPEPILAFANSMVRSDNTLTVDSQVRIPAFRASRAVTPFGWNIAYTNEDIAVTPMNWAEGEEWTVVLDRWGKEHGINVMLDGFNKRIVASPEQPRREPGVVWIHSASTLHQEMYSPEQRYEEAERFSRNLLSQFMGGRDMDYMSLNEVQAQLYTLMQLAHNQSPDPYRLGTYKSREQIESEHVERMAERNSQEAIAERGGLNAPQKQMDSFVMQGGIKLHENGRASYGMTEGPLRAQVEKLLVDSGRVVSSDRVYWQVDEQHQWPSDSVITELSINRLIGSILGGYRLQVRFTANGLALINYVNEGES